MSMCANVGRDGFCTCVCMHVRVRGQPRVSFLKLCFSVSASPAWILQVCQYPMHGISHLGSEG